MKWKNYSDNTNVEMWSQINLLNTCYSFPQTKISCFSYTFHTYNIFLVNYCRYYHHSLDGTKLPITNKNILFYALVTIFIKYISPANNFHFSNYLSAHTYFGEEKSMNSWKLQSQLYEISLCPTSRNSFCNNLPRHC